MINILPTEQRKMNKREYVSRLVLSVCLFFAVMIAVGYVALIPSYILVQQRNKVVDINSQALARQDENIQSKELRSIVREIKSQLQSFNNYQSQFLVAPYVQDSLIKAAPEDVIVQSVSYVNRAEALKPEVSEVNKENSEEVGPPRIVYEVSLDGQAKSREDLLIYADNLRDLDHVLAVDVPIPNFIESENLTYRIEVALDRSSTPYIFE